MDTLEDLRTRMSHSGGKKDSFSSIEMYDGMCKTSEHGRDCQYAAKALSLFFLQDYDEVKDLILQLANQIRDLEESNVISQIREQLDAVK
jgi:hypothetical protein